MPRVLIIYALLVCFVIFASFTRFWLKTLYSAKRLLQLVKLIYIQACSRDHVMGKALLWIDRFFLASMQAAGPATTSGA